MGRVKYDATDKIVKHGSCVSFGTMLCLVEGTLIWSAINRHPLHTHLHAVFRLAWNGATMILFVVYIVISALACSLFWIIFAIIFRKDIIKTVEVRVVKPKYKATHNQPAWMIAAAIGYAVFVWFFTIGFRL